MALVLDFMQRGKKGKNMELELVRKPFVKVVRDDQRERLKQVGRGERNNVKDGGGER